MKRDIIKIAEGKFERIKTPVPSCRGCDLYCNGKCPIDGVSKEICRMWKGDIQYDFILKRIPTIKIEIKFLFEPCDLWVGIFYDKKKSWIYILPLPTLGIIIKLKQ